jgi:hypothetical protein
MSWRDITHRVLPPIGGLSAEVTSPFGATKGRSPPSSIPHGGVDFNYPTGQTGINLKQPTLRSPVAGIVTTNPGEGTFGRIAIRDANGLSHEMLHTHAQYVKRGDLVGIGQPIGRMGNTGTKDQHVHHQLKDSAGHAINPMDFWDRLGPAKTDPGQPAYLDEYQQYLRGPGGNVGNGFGNAPTAANMPAPGSFDAPSDGPPPLYARQTAPRLGRRIAGKIPDCLHPDTSIGYPAGQELADEIRKSGHNGIVYPSARHANGVSLAAFWPGLIQNFQQGESRILKWAGSPTPTITKAANAA